MTRQTTYNLIFNAVGALIGVTVLGYVAYAFFHTERAAPCSARYPAPLRFALHTSTGTLLSPIELQARVGLNEWGVNENARVVEAAEAPGGAALEVTLAGVPDVEAGGRPANGVSFRWAPQGARAAGGVCLSYQVWLPHDFSFENGGLLPGPFGGPPGAGASGPDANGRFAAHPLWRQAGDGTFDVAPTGSGYVPVDRRGFPLPKGRWISIEQELVLNAPGEANGLVRLWLDGALKAETTRLALRTDAAEKFIGVLADIGYVRAPEKAGTLRITPFELSWQ